MVELDAADRLDEVDGAGPVGDERREVEHLEDALERHERGEHVDARVRELRERLVDLARRTRANAAMVPIAIVPEITRLPPTK